MYDVGDIQLLFQPVGFVCIDGEASDESSGRAFYGGGNASSWYCPTHIVSIILEVVVSVYGIKHT